MRSVCAYVYIHALKLRHVSVWHSTPWGKRDWFFCDRGVMVGVFVYICQFLLSRAELNVDKELYLSSTFLRQTVLCDWGCVRFMNLPGNSWGNDRQNTAAFFSSFLLVIRRLLISVWCCLSHNRITNKCVWQ